MARQYAPNPKDFPWQRLDVTRLVLVANSDVSYSRDCLEYYAAERGIPTGNIIDIALGTNRQHYAAANNAALQTVITEPVAAKMATLEPCTGVILGPGCPARVRHTGRFKAGVYSAGDLVYPSLPALMAGARSYVSKLGSDALAARTDSTETFYEWGRIPSGGSWAQLWPEIPYAALGELGPAGGTWEYEAELSTEETGRSTWLPTAAAAADWNRATAATVPVGRLGWCSWSATYDITESEVGVNALVDRATAAMAVATQRHDIHVMISNGSSAQTVWAMLAKQLDAWGFDVSYFYRDTPTAASEAAAPIAGASWTAAAYDAGSSTRDVPVRALVGSSNNENPLTAGNYDDAWAAGAPPLDPVGGVGRMGQSFGFAYGAKMLADQGGVWGITNVTHLIGFYVAQMWGSTWALGTGAPAMLAEYLIGASGGAFLVCGDPLYPPFGFDPAPAPTTPAAPSVASFPRGVRHLGRRRRQRQ